MKTCKDCKYWEKTGTQIDSCGGLCTNPTVAKNTEGHKFVTYELFSCSEYQPKLVQCKNPPCGRYFILKRTGKSVCSAKCANNVRQIRNRSKGSAQLPIVPRPCTSCGEVMYPETRNAGHFLSHKKKFCCYGCTMRPGKHSKWCSLKESIERRGETIFGASDSFPMGGNVREALLSNIKNSQPAVSLKLV